MLDIVNRHRFMQTVRIRTTGSPGVPALAAAAGPGHTQQPAREVATYMGGKPVSERSADSTAHRLHS